MNEDDDKLCWMLYGKAMMVLNGLACLALALLLPVGPAGLFLQVWLGGFGLLNLWFVVSSREQP